MTTRQATLEEALRLIQHDAWCKLHSSQKRVADDAFAGELLLEVSDEGMGFHVCAECLALDPHERPERS